MEKKLLGDYSLIKQIGSGPLGTVYLAEHRFIKKQFAIKILPEELSSDRNFIKRFEKEVKGLASLDHPNIVKVHNISGADGSYFFVTDCIVDALGETTNISQYMSYKRGLLPEEETRVILSQIASALDYAHQRTYDGVPFVHRGIKFNNILIGKGQKGLEVYLSDFGLTKVVGEKLVLTRTYKTLSQCLSIQIGSPNLDRSDVYSDVPDSVSLSKLHQSFLQNYAFLAPEQKLMKSSDTMDPMADVYAFGVLAYYLLMGNFPEGFFPLPNAVHKQYRYNWDHIIYRCLQFDPKKRPRLLAEILEESLHLQELPKIIQKQMDYWKEGNCASTTSSSTITNKNIVTPSLSSISVATTTLSPSKSSSSTLEAPDVASFREELKPLLQPTATLLKEGLKPLLKPTEIHRPTYEADPGAIFHTDPLVARYIPKETQVKDIEPLLTDMSIISGGEFFRGSDENSRDERPRHKVFLSSFALDIHPVTNEQFVLFLESMGAEKDGANNDIIRLRESRIKKTAGKYVIESGYAKHPIVGVSWYGAVAYAKWIGKRLPFEAEWEVIAQGNLVNAVYPTGVNIERSQANFFSADTTAVMSYPPNAYGIYDIAGNVYEWCQDWYDYNYYETSLQEPENPRGPIQGVYRVLRGGCWKSLKEDLRCSHRHRNNPGTMNRTYGFRCATDVR